MRMRRAALPGPRPQPRTLAPPAWSSSAASAAQNPSIAPDYSFATGGVSWGSRPSTSSNLPQHSPQSQQQSSYPYSQTSSYSQSQQSTSSADEPSAAELSKTVHSLTCTVAELKAKLEAIGAANTQSQLALMRETMSNSSSETEKKLSQLQMAISTQEHTSAAQSKSLQGVQSSLLELQSVTESQRQEVDSQRSTTSVDDSRASNSSGKVRPPRSSHRYDPVGSRGRDVVLQGAGSSAYEVTDSTNMIGKDIEIYWVCTPTCIVA